MSAHSPEVSAAPRERFQSLAGLRAEHTELLKRYHSTGAAPELAAALEDFVARGRELGVQLDRAEERIEAQRILDQWGTVLIKVAEGARDDVETTLEEFDLERQPELAESDCPYVGLDAFTEDQAELFYGRQKLIEEWVAKLAALRLLVVIGPSGSGKSSLVTAGVVPALRAGGVAGSESWNYLPPIAPGAAPIAALAALVPGNAHTLETLGKKGGALAEMLTGIALVIVQRFEELFTLCSEPERKLFLEHLAAVASAPAGHRVILTLRNDCIGHIAGAGPLQPLVQKGEVYARPFDASELREVVEKPAEPIGLKFEDGLVDALIFDVLGDPAALLLLQFTLRRLWEKRQRNRITLAAYRELGGGRAAFEQAAKDMVEALSLDDREVLRAVMLRIVRPGPGREAICSTVSRKALCDGVASSAQVDRVLSAAKAAGLVRLLGEESGEQRVRVTHEALIAKWPLLMEWVDEARGAMRQRQQLTAAAAHWMEKEKDPGVLWRGAQLAKADEYKDRNDLEREFIAASLAAETRSKRRWQVLKWGAATAAATAVILAIVHSEQQKWDARQYAALQERSRKESEQQLANTQSALRAANVERGMRRLDLGDPAGAALWFAQLFALNPPEAMLTNVYRRRLETTLRQLPRLLETLPHDREANYAELSRDGTRVLTITVDEEASVPKAGAAWAKGRQTALLWTLKPGAEPSVQSLGGEASFARFSPDGKLVLTVHGVRGSGDGEARIWQADAAEAPVQTLPCNGAVVFGAFSPDGTRVALAQERGATTFTDAVIWDFPAPQRPPLTLPHDRLRIGRLSWSPRGDRLATACTNEGGGTARLYDLPSVEPRVLKHKAAVNDIVFSHDGKRILTASGARGGESGEAQLWDAETGEKTGFPLLHQGGVVTAQFSPDDRLIATASTDATARLWSADTAREILSCPHDGWVYWLDFSPDGRFFATGSRDRLARVWDIASGQLALPPMNHYGTVPFVFFSEDGQRLIAAGKETPRLWALANGDRPAAVFNTGGPVTAFALSADGTTAATVSEIVAGEKWKVHVSDVATGVARHVFDSEQPFTSIGLRPNGADVAVGYADHENEVYRVEIHAAGSTEVSSEMPHGGEVTSIVWSRDGASLATLSRDAAGDLTLAQVWDSASGTPRTDALNHDVTLTSVVFSQDGAHLLTTGGARDPRGGEANVWKVAPGRHDAVVVEHGEIVTCGAFSSDGTLIVTGSEDNYVRVWDAASGEPRSALLRNLHSADQTSVSFHPKNSARILTASYDQTSVVCDWATEKKIAVFRHGGVVQSAAFSPLDGSRVVTASSDRTARVWDVESNELIAIFKHPNAPQQARFTPDDERVVAFSYNIGSGASAPSQMAPPGTIPVSSSPDAAVEPPRRQVQAHTWNVAVTDTHAAEDLGRFAQILSTRKHSGDLLDTLPVEKLIADWRELRASYEKNYRAETSKAFHQRNADAAEAAKQWSGAVWHLDRLLALHPGDAALLSRRARSRAKLLQWKPAIADYTAALEAAPDDVTLRYERGRAASDAGEWKLAQTDCEAVVAGAPAHVEARLTLAAVHAQQGHWGEAAINLKEIATPARRHAGHWQKLALVQLRGGQLEDYRATCTAMLERFGDVPSLGSTISWPCVLGTVAVADLNQLLEIANKAVDENPNYYRLNTLGAVLYRAGRYKEAIDAVTRSQKAYAIAMAARIAELRDDSFHSRQTSIDEGRAIDWVFLAMAYFQEGKTDAAERWLNKVAKSVRGSVPAGVEISAARRLWNELELKLLFNEAQELIQPAAPQARN